MRVVNLFEVIHINEDKTTVVFLHKLRHQLLTTTPHRQSGQKIISFTVLVCFQDVYKRQRKYPAIHPMDSWSKYDGVVDMARVEEARSILHRGNEINQMMKVVGEEGTSAEDYIIYQKGELLDSVYLQQNSFDPIDAACSPDRQREEFGVLYDALMASYDLDDKNEIRGFFNQLRQEFLDWHGTEFESPEFLSLIHI